MANIQAQPWELRDTLREMTEKYNGAVEVINSLQDSSTTVNAATTEKLNELETNLNNSIESLTQQLNDKVDEVSAADLGLDKVDNTSDMDKPVSTAQQAAIDAAVEDMITSEEVEELNVLNLYAPEVSTPVKEYIESRIRELFNGYTGGDFTASYNIASSDELGVVKSGGDILVDSDTGLMNVPALPTIQSDVTTMKTNINAMLTSLETNNTATSQIEQEKGTLDTLKTQNKTSIVDAINELYDMIQELDNQ